MKEHLKAVVWPKGEFTSESGQKVHRYVVIGMLVTDTPIEQFEGKNEIVLDAPTNKVVGALTSFPQRKSKQQSMDASSTLLSLDII